jgi:DNA-binding HxlR family transcriptional regulator
MKKTTAEEHSKCTEILKPVRDSLDVLSGKWKLPIIIALTFGEKRFTEITKEVHGITDKMLSKELRDLELNGLVMRNIEDSYPVKVTYALTPHSKTLRPVIDSLKNWGIMHKEKLTQECRDYKNGVKKTGRGKKELNNQTA